MNQSPYRRKGEEKYVCRNPQSQQNAPKRKGRKDETQEKKQGEAPKKANTTSGMTTEVPECEESFFKTVHTTIHLEGVERSLIIL